MKVLASARVGALVLTLLPLAACAGDDRGPVVLPPAKSSTPASSAGSSPAGSEESSKPRKPHKPGEFDEATKRSAEEFVRDYWKRVNSLLAGESRDLNTLKSLSSPACAPCRDVYRDVEQVVERRQRQEGGELRLLRADFQTNRGRVALVDAVVKTTPGKLVDRNGELIQEYPGGLPVRFVFNLVRTDSSWYIQDILKLGSK